MAHDDDWARQENTECGKVIRVDDDRSDVQPDDDGVDVTLIRWMLSMTPAERLDTLQNFLNAVLETREKNANL
jgi:hypothetical protein